MLFICHKLRQTKRNPLIVFFPPLCAWMRKLRLKIGEKKRDNPKKEHNRGGKARGNKIPRREFYRRAQIHLVLVYFFPLGEWVSVNFRWELNIHFGPGGVPLPPSSDHSIPSPSLSLSPHASSGSVRFTHLHQKHFSPRLFYAPESVCK